MTVGNGGSGQASSCPLLKRGGPVLNILGTLTTYEPVDQDFFIHRSLILPDQPEESAFLATVRRWLEMADSALKNENHIPVVMNRYSKMTTSQNAC